MAQRETPVGSDPVLVNTAADLAGALNGLRRRCGLSYGTIEQAARKLRPRPGEPPYEPLRKSTVGEIVTGQRLPTAGKLRTYLAVCQVHPADQAQWRAAWERVRIAGQTRPDRAVRVRDARPRHIGVHAAIQVAEHADDLPTYVPRDVDGALRARLRAGVASGCFLVLVGGSSVGKTRTLYEAVLAVMPEWWLVQPADVQEITVGAGASPVRTVLWLDELQRYLGGANGLSANCVRSLVHAGVVVVGTLWPDEYATRMAPRSPGAEDLHDRDRELLDMAQVIDVASTFSTTETQKARTIAKQDVRVRAALDSADGGVTQVLAVGPQLVRRWEQAPDPYKEAILTAAIDARRVGVTSPLAEDVLAAAVPGYLTPAQRATAPADWLPRALAYATTSLHGAAAALSPVAGDTMGHTAGYLVADFLFQHARQVRRTSPIHTTAWQSIVGYVTDLDEMYRVAGSAYERGLYCYAEPIYRRIVDGRPWWATAASRLTKILVRQGRVDEAARLLRPLRGYDAAHALAYVLGQHHRVEDAIEVLSPWLESEEVGRYAAWRLADLHAKLGHDEEALELLRPVFLDCDEDPDRHSGSLRARLLSRLGRVDELREIAATGDDIATEHVIRILVGQGNLHGAVSFLRELIRSSPDDWVVARHARLLAEHGRANEVLDTEDWEWDDPAWDWWPCLEVEVELYAGLGRLDEANRLVDDVRKHADSEDWAREDLPDLLAFVGRFDELYVRAQAGDNRAATKLADVLHDKAHAANTAAFLRSHGTDVLLDLAELLGRRAYVIEGLTVLETHGIATGLCGTAEHAQTLADFAERYGELDSLRAGVDGGNYQAAAQLTGILLAMRDIDGLRAESRAGTEWSFLRLIKALEALGRHEEASHVRRYGFSTDE